MSLESENNCTLINYHTLINVLYKQNHDQLYYLAFRRLHNKEEAEDVVEDVFLHILSYPQKYAKYDYETMIKLIKTITDRIAIKRYNKICKEQQINAKLRMGGGIREDVMFDEGVYTRDYIGRMITFLEINYRKYFEMIILRYYWDLSFCEISIRLGITESNARKRCSRALHVIRVSCPQE